MECHDAGRRREHGSRIRTAAGCLLVAAGFALGGCAGFGKSVTAPAAPVPAAVSAPAPKVPSGPSVSHYTDGREGFVITEAYGMNFEARGDFDHASALIREGKYDRAAELLESVIERVPEATAPHINAAIAYRRMNSPEKAEQHLKKALESIPGHPVASNEYGLLLRGAGRFAESRQVYEKSLASFPEYHPIHRNLAILCDLYLKDQACAVEHFEIYGRAVPRDPQVKLWLADLNARSGKSLTASAGRDAEVAMSRR